MTKKQKKVLIRIIISAVLLVGLMVLTRLIDINVYVKLGLYLIPYLIIGYDILKKAALGIWHREVFDENFLMAVATLGAVSVLCSRKEPEEYYGTDGYSPGLCEY